MCNTAMKPKIALLYDFDGTLSPANMQEYDFMDAIGIKDRNSFWHEVYGLARQQSASTILSYMKLMIDKAKEQGVSIRREQFVDFGRGVELYPGVEEWFDMINSEGEKMGVEIEHYIISSGLKEMIEGTQIAKHFKEIYACSFMYQDDAAIWPAVAVDFTSKTQFIFMINKGIYDIYDNNRINDSMPEDTRPVPFGHMIYIGDGETDIPSMRIIKSEGGHSIAIYKKDMVGSREQAESLVRRGRVNFACPSNYSKDSELYKVVMATISKIRSDYNFRELETENRLALEGRAYS